IRYTRGCTHAAVRASAPVENIFHPPASSRACSGPSRSFVSAECACLCVLLDRVEEKSQADGAPPPSDEDVPDGPNNHSPTIATAPSGSIAFAPMNKYSISNPFSADNRNAAADSGDVRRTQIPFCCALEISSTSIARYPL